MLRGDDWNHTSASDNPCGSPMMDLCIAYTAEAQQQAGVQVNQAPRLLAPTLARLLSHMRKKARLSTSAQESMEIARDVALYTLCCSIRCGGDSTFLLLWGPNCSACPTYRDGLFQFGKTLRSSQDARVVLADPDRAQTCAVQGVSAYLEAALRQGWDLSLGHLFPAVKAQGQRGHEPMTPPRMYEDRILPASPSGGAAGSLYYPFLPGGRLAEPVPGGDPRERNHDGALRM